MSAAGERPLRVGFDATAAAVPRPTGVGLAIAHLARALRARPDLALELGCWLSCWRQRRHLSAPARLFHPRLSRGWGRGLDVFHGPDTRLPSFPVAARVATVHDLSARRAEFCSERFRRTREAHWRQALQQADLIVTYTAAIRAEVVAALGCAPERVAVVPLAATAALQGPPSPEDRARVAALTGGAPYVLVLGERSRRKNVAGAVQAFAAAGQALAGHRLVLAGPGGHGEEELHQALAGSGCAGRVVLADYLPAGQLGELLRGASALLFPSRYEGFGLPLLEAFAAGVPAVTSREPSLLEVGGGAALHAEAEDAQGLGRALVALVEDPALRERTCAAGRARLAAFTWERSATLLAEVYRAARDGRPAPPPEVAACSP